MKRYLIAGCGLILVVALYSVLNLVRVPSVAGTYQEAMNRLRAAGLHVQAVDAAGQPRDPHDLELVVSQSPGAGAIASLDSTVTLRTRVPSAEVVVPDVVGRRVSQAISIVHDAGLWLDSDGVITHPGSLTRAPDGSMVHDGIIATTYPAPHALVPFGTDVVYFLVG